MVRARALVVVIAVGAIACNGDHRSRAPVGPTSAGSDSAGSASTGAAAGSSAALPAAERCLWLNVCDQWAGCAHIVQDGSGWKVITAEGFAAGDRIEVLDMCTGQPVCLSAMGYPKGVTCPDHSVPPFIHEPDYVCEWTGAACVRTPKPTVQP
jgi:hypothetical protein